MGVQLSKKVESSMSWARWLLSLGCSLMRLAGVTWRCSERLDFSGGWLFAPLGDLPREAGGGSASGLSRRYLRWTSQQ